MANTQTIKHQLKAIEVTIGLIKQLNSQERVILALYYYEDLDVSEIAQVLQLTEAQVERKLLEIHDQIKAILTTGTAHDQPTQNMAAQAY